MALSHAVGGVGLHSAMTIAVTICLWWLICLLVVFVMLSGVRGREKIRDKVVATVFKSTLVDRPPKCTLWTV